MQTLSTKVEIKKVARPSGIVTEQASKPRQNLIAKIHIAKKDLGLDDGTYKDVLKRITGKDSSKNMTLNELKAVLDDFSRRGFVAKRTAKTAKRHGKKPKAHQQNQSRQAMIDKIEAILADMGLHWNYAHAMSRNMFGKFQLQFCTDDEMMKVMQAMAVYQRRHKNNKQS